MIDTVKFKTTSDGWLGTPWMHFQRIKGHGVDCAWFVCEVAKEMGWIPTDTMLSWYPQDWAQHNAKSGILAELEKYCVQVDKTDMQIGDVLTYRYGLCASHVGFCYEGGKGIHSHIRRGVAVFDLSEIDRRLHSVWRLRAVM